jgi:hypothetical protein
MTYTLFYTLILAAIFLARRYYNTQLGKTKWPGRRREPSIVRLLHLFF